MNRSRTSTTLTTSRIFFQNDRGGALEAQRQLLLPQRAGWLLLPDHEGQRLLQSYGTSGSLRASGTTRATGALAPSALRRCGWGTSPVAAVQKICTAPGGKPGTCCEREIRRQHPSRARESESQSTQRDAVIGRGSECRQQAKSPVPLMHRGRGYCAGKSMQHRRNELIGWSTLGWSCQRHGRNRPIHTGRCWRQTDRDYSSNSNAVTTRSNSSKIGARPVAWRDPQGPRCIRTKTPTPAEQPCCR